ncbi:MAG: mechanosensitive ion channel family protein [Chloroflexota bacterium]
MNFTDLLLFLDNVVTRKALLSGGILLIIGIVRFVVLRIVAYQTESEVARFQWQKAMSYTAYVIAVFVIGPIWSDGFTNMTTYLGLFSAGVAIALQPLIISLAGWIYILSRRPFRVGNRIQVGDFAGDVLDIRPFQFILMEIGNWVDSDQSTGRIIHVPNSKVFTESLANYNDGVDFIWNEISVVITFESNWRKAKELLQAIVDNHSSMTQETARRKVREASKHFLIFYRNLTPNVYTSVVENGVDLTIRYLCEPRRRRGSAEIIWEEVLDMLSENADIRLAYPTQRFYIAPNQQDSNGIVNPRLPTHIQNLTPHDLTPRDASDD